MLSMGRSVQIEAHEVALLEDRVRKLRAAGDRFENIALSIHVTKGSMTCVPGRVRGDCVATEV